MRGNKPPAQRTAFSSITKLGDYNLAFSFGRSKIQRLTIMGAEIGVGVESEISLWELEKLERQAIEYAFDEAMLTAQNYKQTLLFNVGNEEIPLERHFHIVIVPRDIKAKDFLGKQHFTCTVAIWTDPGDSNLTADQMAELKFELFRARREAVNLATQLKNHIVNVLGRRKDLRFEDGGVRCFVYD